MSVKEIVNKLVSRKFILAMVIIILSMIGLALGLIDSGSWVAIATIVMGAYGASNVAQKITKRGENV